MNLTSVTLNVTIRYAPTNAQIRGLMQFRTLRAGAQSFYKFNKGLNTIARFSSIANSP